MGLEYVFWRTSLHFHISPAKCFLICFSSLNYVSTAWQHTGALQDYMSSHLSEPLYHDRIHPPSPRISINFNVKSSPEIFCIGGVSGSILFSSVMYCRQAWIDVSMSEMIRVFNIAYALPVEKCFRATRTRGTVPIPENECAHQLPHRYLKVTSFLSRCLL